ncbi:MAG: NADH-quinone oxidoreductase subunit A [Chloroflexota bacterium]|nr:NADH-quinone oxidoreductase subunit A [Chloroflexota bacterium]
MNFAPYIAIGLLFILSTALALIVVLLGAILGPNKPSERKLQPYESGMVPVGAAMQRLPIRFYLVATLFIIVDIEIIFLFPWALILRDLGLFGLIEVAVFLLILLAGYIYIWKKGALEWD